MDEHTPNILAWRVHPARERPLAACAAIGVIAAMRWLAADVMQHAGWGVFATVVLLVALQRFFLPSAWPKSKLDERLAAGCVARALQSSFP